MRSPLRPETWQKWRPWLIAAVALGLAALLTHALGVLSHEVRYADVVRQIAREPLSDLALAALATAISYLLLTRYDAYALEYVGARVRASTVVLTSFIAYALGNTVGLGVLTGGAVRMRLYTAAGVEPTRVTKVIAFNASAFAIGIVVFGALGLLWAAPDIASLLKAPAWTLRVIAVLVLACIVILLLVSIRQREVRVLRWTLPLLPTKLAARLLVISVLDLGASAAALWLLLPEGVINPFVFVGWYAIAVTLGLVSHIPGGLGVFDAVIVLACAGRAPPGEIVGALVLYRVIYYLAPLMLGAVLLAGYELRTGIAAPIARAAVSLSPLLLATLTFIAGGWLLLSGVTPATHEATALLAMHVPLPLVEASHFIGSIAGVAMLIVARGLLHRLDAAWWAAFLAALVAAALALPKGIALTEMSYFTALAFLLLTSRRQFHRRSVLFAQAVSAQWLLAVAAVIGASAYLLVIVYKDVDYGHELLWQFAFDAHAPRSLRATAGVAVAVLWIALWRLLRPGPAGPALPTTTDLARAKTILAAQPFADANLALMGDKHILFSQTGSAFIMFGRQARSWIALFDPVGPASEWPELVWRFIELAADHGARAACYQVRPQSLPIYLDAGLRAFKLGEYAYVPLADFNLKGSKRSGLRQALNRGERESLSFTLLDAEEARATLPQLKAVSDAWLKSLRAREKGFSLGAFDPHYLLHQPIAIVRQQDRIVAFANILCTNQKCEVTIDLMRHTPDAASITMDFLFVQLLLHFKEQGYERFGLGMAPLSGMAKHELAPRWHRLGNLLFDHGEALYNFRGLRSFKEKFLPVWEPRYLAAPGGLAALATLTDVTALISRGLPGVLAK